MSREAGAGYCFRNSSLQTVCVWGEGGGGERDVAGLNIHNLIIHTKFPDFLVC